MSRRVKINPDDLIPHMHHSQVDAEALDRQRQQEDAATEARKVERATTFKQEVFDYICEQVAGGRSLRSVCREEGMPPKVTVNWWVTHDKPAGVAAQFMRAKEMQLATLEDELLDIADDSSNDFVERQRKDGTVETVFDKEAVLRDQLRVKTRQWVLSHLSARFRQKLELHGPGGGPVQTANINLNTSDPREASRAYQRLLTAGREQP